MSKAKMKRVTLHPLLEDGSMDTSVNLYPKTLIDGIIDESGAPVKVLTDADLDDIKSEIAVEEVRAIEAEEALQVNINEEIERASTRENELESIISVEQERAESAEERLQTNIEAEEIRAKSTEEALQDDLDTANGRINSLERDIKAEETRATEAEAELQRKITAEETRAEGIEADLDERTSAIESSLDNFVVKEDGKGLSTNDFTDDDKSNLDNISDSIKVYNYFPSYSDGYIEVPVEAKQAFDIREISTKYSDDLGFSGQIVVDGSWHVFTFDEEYPIFNSDMKPVTLYQTGSPEDSLTLKYAYDNMNLETRTINRYCRAISLSEFVKAFATTDWGWSGTAANGRLTISHDKVSEAFGVLTVGWKTNRIIDPNEVFGELVVKSISNINFGIDNCKSISESITNKAAAIAALTSSDFDNVYIVFKRDNIEIESFEDYNITEVNYSFRLSSDDDTPGIQGTEWATFQLTYHSITDIFYNKDQTDTKFLTIESFNETSKGREPIYKIGDLADDNKLEARTAAEIYNILKSFNPQYPQYACAVFVPVSEDSEPITGDAVPFDSYTLFINQRRPLDTNPVTYEYGYRVLSQNKEYWLTKTSVKEITAATEEYVDASLATKQNILISGETIKTINNESILGSGNIEIQGGGNVTDLYLEFEDEPTQEQLEQIYTQKPDILRIGTNGGQHIIVLFKSVQSEDETRLYYFNIQNGAGDIQVLKIEYSEEDGYIAEPYEWSLDNLYTSQETDSLLNNKQDTLVSGANIKTINNESLLGEGNINISGGYDIYDYDDTAETAERIYNDQPAAIRLSQPDSGLEVYLYKTEVRDDALYYSGSTFIESEGFIESESGLITYVLKVFFDGKEDYASELSYYHSYSEIDLTDSEGIIEKVYNERPMIVHIQTPAIGEIFLQKTDFINDVLYYRAAINNERLGGDVILEMSISPTTDPETGDISYEMNQRVIPISGQPAAESDLTIMTNPADLASIVHAYATGDSTGFKENHKYGLSGDTFVDFFTDSLNSEDLYWLMRGRSYENRLIMFNGEKLKLDKSAADTYRLHNSDDSVQITLVRAEKDTVTVNISDQFAYLEIIFFHYEGE